MEIVTIVLFVLLIILILSGYPVAFVLGGISIIIGMIFVPDFLDFLPLRIMGTMQNYVLLAVPLFVSMGLVLEKSGIAEELLYTMSILFGKIKGGLALSVVIVGTLLAASTGIVGATVIAMGLISLPVMLKRGYSVPLATGVIMSSGTLGQIIPPSVVLVLLGNVLNVSVGDLFKGALLPGFILVLAYVIYIIIFSKLYPSLTPSLSDEEISAFKLDNYKQKLIKTFVFPMVLIFLVLGSIFSGIASPTEAAAIGAIGAMGLVLLQGKLTKKLLSEVAKETTFLTSMVFMILLGATTFSIVFRGLGGDKMLMDIVQNSEMSSMAFLLFVMVIVFVAGFFIDFIEIIFIIVPVVAPLFQQMGVDLLWLGILLAINLQTSFLTPPFGFALFYLRAVAPPEVTTKHLYMGVLPFLCIQLMVLILIIVFPSLVS